MKTRQAVTFGLVLTQTVLPLFVAGAVLLQPQLVFATDQSTWTTCTQTVLRYINESEPGISSVAGAIAAVINSATIRARFAENYKTGLCHNEPFAISQHITNNIGEFDPVAVVNAYKNYRSAEQATSDGTEGGGGGGGGTPTPTEPTEAETNDWKACVNNALMGYSVRSSEVIDNNATDALRVLLNSANVGERNTFMEYYKTADGSRDCSAKAYVTKTGLSKTDASAIIAKYNSLINPTTGGGDTPGDGTDTPATTDPDSKEAEATCGSFGTVLKSIVNPILGIKYMLCNVVYLGKFFLRNVLTWMGADSTSLKSMGATGSANIGGGGVTVTP